MAEIVRMPKMSDTMTDGVIAKWHKKVGEVVKAGELMAEIETDKATMDYESYSEGVVLHLGAAEGESIGVDSILAVVGKKGEDFSSLLAGKEAAATPEVPPAKEEKNTQNGAPIDTSSIKAEIVLMPKMSDTMAEGVIAKWHKKIGEQVNSGELLAEIETDKATMDYESYHTGTLLYKGAEEQESIPVDSVLSIIGEKNADWKTLLQSRQQTTKSADKEQASPTAAVPSAKPPASTSSPKEERVKASPLAKRIAQEKGYEITAIQGSGDGGRVIKRDVENYKQDTSVAGKDTPAITLAPVVGEEKYEDQLLSQTRKTIARRLSESKFGAPHFYLTMDIDMDKAIEARKSINEIAPIKISFNDIITKAVATSLRQHLDVNSSWRDNNTIRKNHHIHIGIAVAIEDGLVVPVVRFADNKSLAHIAAEIKDSVQKAHAKKLQPTDWEGSTFTISNLGMFGIEQFTAIINPPDACILAVGGIQEMAVAKEGKIVLGNVMKVTLSCDHRVVDGAVGAAFLKTLKSLLENPVRILI